MKLRVIWTGRTRNRFLAGLLDDYAARIRRFVPLDLVELKEPRTRDDLERIAKESEKILRRIGDDDYVVVLDDAGESRTSEELARLVEQRMGDGQRDLSFVVGGPAGLSESLKQRADLRLSLSRLTLSHDLARATVMEQVYRALTIIRNLPYAR